MSQAEQTAESLETSRSGVLIVSDADDPELRGFRAAIGRAGVPIESAPDVYAATAKLARGECVGKIVVDVRTLDDKEMAFLRLVPRFFPRCELIVPAFDGVEGRASLRAAGFQPVTLNAALEAAVAGYVEIASREEIGLLGPEAAATDVPATPLEEGAYCEGHAPVRMEPENAIPPEPQEIEAPSSPGIFSLPPPVSDSPIGELPENASPNGVVESSPGLRLSTDGGAEAADNRPAIHEVVRRRMAAEEPRPIRRPPPRTPPGGKPVQPPVVPTENMRATPLGPMDPMLSPDEMDALLRDDETAWEETPPPDESEGDAK